MKRKKQINFANQLVRFRNAKGLTQQQAAELAGVTRPTMGAIEEGRAELKVSTLVRLADAYGVSLDQFINEDWIGKHRKDLVSAYNSADNFKRSVVDLVLNVKSKR